MYMNVNLKTFDKHCPNAGLLKHQSEFCRVNVILAGQQTIIISRMTSEAALAECLVCLST